MERYFEDYVPGSVFEFGHVVVDETEVIEFAKRYDPQYIHTDPAAAAAGPFNGLIASGWHTAGLMMRMFVESYLSEASSLASPGIDELRWMKPVRPGDRLTLRVTVLQVKRSTSKPDRGMVRTFVEVVNSAGEVVMSLKAMNLMRLRNAKV